MLANIEVSYPYLHVFSVQIQALSLSQHKQDAQLSQRDRAAGCVIVFAKSKRLELGDDIYGHYRSTFNHCDTIGLKIC